MCTAWRSAPTVRGSPPAVPTRHGGCGQAHDQHEPPAVAGLGCRRTSTTSRRVRDFRSHRTPQPTTANGDWLLSRGSSTGNCLVGNGPGGDVRWPRVSGFPIRTTSRLRGTASGVGYPARSAPPSSGPIPRKWHQVRAAPQGRRHRAHCHRQADGGRGAHRQGHRHVPRGQPGDAISVPLVGARSSSPVCAGRRPLKD